MAQAKPLLIPWLRAQIDSQRYPGVSWMNQERTQFCVPWKHALRQDSNNDDVLIFKAWAETSSGGQMPPGDPSVWKRNFRSALRAKGFKLLYDNKNDAANPHKVYQWPPEDVQSGGSQEPDAPLPVFDDIYLASDNFLPGGISSPDMLQHCLEVLNICEPQPEIIHCPVPFEGQWAVGGESYPMERAMAGGPYPVQETCFVGPCSPADGAVPGVVDDAVAVNFWNEMNKTVEESILHTHFEVLVYYKGKKVLETLVESEAGFRLVYSPDTSQLLDQTLPLIYLPMPSPDLISDQTQTRLTQEILDSLGGVEVRVEGAVALGQRWGDSRAYWSICKHDQSTTPRLLSKLQPEPIFSMKDFISALLDFINKEGKSPPFSLFFCLGEKWPDPKLKPWDRKLIMVEVVFKALEKLKMMAVEGGASSLQSVDLQLSLEQLMETC